MRKFINFFKTDWVMKLISLGIAALLWFFVIAQENPTRVKEYADIPVTFVGAETLREKGLCLTDSTEDILESVNVSVEAEISDLQKLTEDDITATVDMSNVNVAGTYSLNVRARSLRGSVSVVTPSEVEITVENIATRELPVEIQVVGNDNDALYYGKPVLSADTVIVEGSQSSVEHYSKAVVVVDVTGLDQTYRESRTITLISEDGSIVPSDDYDYALPSVIVELPIYHTVSIPVDKEAILAGVKGVASGYEITDVILSQDRIKVAGSEEDLAGIASVSLERVTLDNAMYDSTVQIGVNIPPGALAVDPDTITATFKIAVHKDSQSMGPVPVEVRNLADGLKCSINPESVDIVVSGPTSVMKDLSSDDITAYIDMSGVEAGIHTAVLKYEYDPELDIEIVSTDETIEVEVTK